VSCFTNNAWVVTRSLHYAWQGWKLAAECERDGVGAITAVRHFVWGPDIAGQQSASLESEAEGVGGLLLIREWKLGRGMKQYLPLTDGLGSVCGLIDATDGSLVAEYDYDPYGGPVIERGVAADACPFRHRTRYHDSESWLYYYGYRYYDPSTTKWISKDPLGEEGGWNLTCFCNNDPVNGYDPTGLKVWVDAEWAIDAAGKSYATKQAHYDRELKQWVFRTTGVNIKPLKTIKWAFNEYQIEFEKLIEIDEGLKLYTFLDTHKDDLLITFQDLPDVRGQVRAKSYVNGKLIPAGSIFNPYLLTSSPLKPGYGTIGHEFQHLIEFLCKLDLLENKGRKPTPEEEISFQDKVLKVSSTDQSQNENMVVVFENWLGKNEQGKLSTAGEATAVRVQNIIVMKYKSKHKERQQMPIFYYQKEGFVVNPVPSEYWTEDYRKYREEAGR
jgi:RHS repeat-associated protein